MIAIDKPYVSELLIKTIQENNFSVIDTPEARSLIADNQLNWISEKDAKNHLEENPHLPFYSNSENSIGWIENNAAKTKLPEQIKLFKNKIKFRELLQDIYPNYFFKGIAYKDLKDLNPENLKFPLIVKPAVGFFSIAVHKVNTANEWYSIIGEIEKDLDNTNDIYPKSVIDISDFIIEECIDGEEYAIDCYFNNEGKPVVLNILHHVFSSDKDVSDRVYTTSKNIIETHKQGVVDFLNLIGNKAGLVNFPAHVEIRIDSKGTIIPIEVNPLRFGGWCTTGDLSWFAYGFNSYEYFFNSKSPDWEEIFRTRANKKYSIIVLDNNSGIHESEIESFNYQQLAKDFEKPLEIREVDFRTYPVFGFIFIETTTGNEKELRNILASNLREYIKLR